MNKSYVQLLDEQNVRALAAREAHITYEPLYTDTVAPTRATDESAGYDVSAYLHNRDITVYDNLHKMVWPVYEDLTIPAGHRALVPLGFKATLPAGFEAQVRPRSGRALKEGLTITNSPGTIDSDYPGEWGVIVQNTNPTQPIRIQHGERIAQVVIAQVHHFEFRLGQVGQTTDRAGGFGHTGS